MRKGWGSLIVFALILVATSSPAYSYLPESKKNEFEKCPLETYVSIMGDGVYSIACKSVTIEQGYTEIYFNTSCDEGNDKIIPYVNLGEGKYGGKADKQKGLWKLHDFTLEEIPYLLKCVSNKTLLKDQKIWINIRSSFDIDIAKNQKEIKKEIERIANDAKKQTTNTEEIINKSDEVIKGLRDSKNLLGSINTTMQQTNATLITIQKSQNCKENFDLWPEFLGMVLGIIFVGIGLTTKRNKKLRRKLWILAAIVIILVIIARLIITFFICNY